MYNNIYYNYDSYILYALPALIITIYAQLRVRSAYNKYSRIRMSSGMSGLEAAKRILSANGLNDIQIELSSGMISDHYDPQRRVLRLSDEVMHGGSIASVAIAAHECGHAIQHQMNYGFLQLRSSIVSYANFGSTVSYALILLGLLFGSPALLFAGIVFYSVFVFFQLVTLPVEFNASARAKAEVERLGLASGDEAEGMSRMLSAAALTYVAAMLAALLQLFRLISIFNRRRR